MFTTAQKHEIAEKVQRALRETRNPELPKGEISFHLHVKGAESWSWADILNNEAVMPAAPRCNCVQGVTKCPDHGEQPAKRGLCPKCRSVLGYCIEGEYCTNETCNYAY